MWYQTHETIDGEHGRIETRRTTIFPLMYLHSFKLKWKGLQSIARVENQRQIGKHTSRESRYYITSLPSDAKRIGSAIRQHWSIENQLHWSKDYLILFSFLVLLCFFKKNNLN